RHDPHRRDLHGRGALQPFGDRTDPRARGRGARHGHGMSGGAGYLGAMASIGVEDVPALYEGAKFYSPAVGDAGRSSVTSWLSGLLERNGPVPLLRVESVAPDTPCVSVCVLGSGSAMADLPPAGDEFVAAVRQIERLQRVRFGAIYPLAAATISALVAVVTAAQLGVPLLDADGMGRTFALIH